MKIKLDSVEALAKAHGGLGGGFKKMAEHHEEMSKAYGQHAAFMKGKADAMTDEEMHKAAFHKMAEHADGLHKMHKAMSDHLHKMAEEHGDESDKGAAATSVAKGGTPAPEPETGDQPNMGKFLSGVMVSSMDELGKSAEFKDMVRDFVLQEAKKALGQTIVPTAIKVNGATAHDPSKEPHLVARPGETLPALEKTEMPAALAHFGGDS